MIAGFVGVMALLLLGLGLNGNGSDSQVPPQHSVAASGPQHRP